MNRRTLLLVLVGAAVGALLGVLTGDLWSWLGMGAGSGLLSGFAITRTDSPGSSSIRMLWTPRERRRRRRPW